MNASDNPFSSFSVLLCRQERDIRPLGQSVGADEDPFGNDEAGGGALGVVLDAEVAGLEGGGVAVAGHGAHGDAVGEGEGVVVYGEGVEEGRRHGGGLG